MLLFQHCTNIKQRGKKMKWISKRFNFFSIDIPYISVNLKYSKITLPRTKSLNILWSISSNFQKVKKKRSFIVIQSSLYNKSHNRTTKRRGRVEHYHKSSMFTKKVPSPYKYVFKSPLSVTDRWTKVIWSCARNNSPAERSESNC